MTIRSEDTLRRMWAEHLVLRDKAAAQSTEEKKEREAAETAEQVAAAARQAEHAARITGTGMAAESADLADLVNREREALGLRQLANDEEYPADQPTDDPTVTRQDVHAYVPADQVQATPAYGGQQ